MIALLLAAQIVASAPPLTPREAVRVLTGSHSDRDWANRAAEIRPYGPIFLIIGSQPTPLERPARRLDGTLLTDPVAVYGAPWWGARRPAPGLPPNRPRPRGGR